MHKEKLYIYLDEVTQIVTQILTKPVVVLAVVGVYHFRIIISVFAGMF